MSDQPKREHSSEALECVADALHQVLPPSASVSYQSIAKRILMELKQRDLIVVKMP